MTATTFAASVLCIVSVYESDGTQERLDPLGGGGGRADTTFASFSRGEEGVPKQSFVGGGGRSIVVRCVLEEEAAAVVPADYFIGVVVVVIVEEGAGAGCQLRFGVFEGERVCFLHCLWRVEDGLETL